MRGESSESSNLHIVISFDKSSTILRKEITKRVREEATSEGAKKRLDVLLVDTNQPSDWRRRKRQEASETIIALSK